MYRPSDFISLKKITHRGSPQMFLKFSGRADWLKAIKTIKSLKYSKTHKSWYLPLEKESYRDFKKLDIPFRIDSLDNDDEKHKKNVDFKSKTNPTESGTTDIVRSKCANTGIVSKSTNSVISQTDKEENAAIHFKKKEIVFNGKSFFLKMPYHEEDVEFVKSLKRSWWHVDSKSWIIQANVNNLHNLQRHFSLWEKESFERIHELVQKTCNPLRIKLYRTPEYPKKVAVVISGYRADVDFMKHIPLRDYDKEYKRWLIPMDNHIVNRVIEHYSSAGAQIVNRLPKKRAEYLSKMPSLKDRQKWLLEKIGKEHRRVLKKYTDTLILQRYSWNTIRSYSGVFVKYLIASQKKPLEEHTADDVIQYISNIAARKVSESTINRTHSAIKFYFGKVVFRPDFKLKKIKRPRKGRYLPTILSTEEVSRILSATANLKHTTILYTLYSGGLRLDELLSLRVDDISWDRNQILIKSGKGNKDRMVMLSDTLKKVLKKYCEMYQPEYWLFEGIDRKKQYGRTSVQKMVKRSVKAAGITKKVSPHTLRHCFATHLLDNGTSIRYIQELLGHKDIKTTLIYTHVTNAQASAIKSPLDSLNLDNKKGQKDE